MSFNKSPGAFGDIREAFQQALDSPKGLKITCPTRAEAILLRSRFNFFRKRDRLANSEIYQPGHPMHGNSRYDALVLRIPPKNSPDANVLYILPNTLGGLVEEIS